MNQFLVLLAFGTGGVRGGGGSIIATPGSVFFWICLTSLVIISCALTYYLQRKELILTRLFQYGVRLSKDQLSMLNKFPYYDVLNSQDKVKFEKRVRHFLVNKKFVPHEMTEVTEVMRTSIAIAWTRLIFRHRPFYLSHFKTIHVYPSHQTDILEIKKRKQLILSWKEFQQGYNSDDDGYNPGMSALAIALILEDHSRHKEDKLFEGNAAYNWHIVSVPLVQSFAHHFFGHDHPQAPLEEEEFFALAVVYFFERPQDFQEQFPTLYSALSELLREYSLPFNS